VEPQTAATGQTLFSVPSLQQVVVAAVYLMVLVLLVALVVVQAIVVVVVLELLIKVSLGRTTATRRMWVLVVVVRLRLDKQAREVMFGTVALVALVAQAASLAVP
jgi:hypothetical protein